MFLKGPASSFTERRRTFSEPQKSQVPALSLCSLTYLFNQEWAKQFEQQNICIPHVCWFPVLHDTNSCSLARVLREGHLPSLQPLILLAFSAPHPCGPVPARNAGPYVRTSVQQ